MQYMKSAAGLLVRLELGEEVLESLGRLCETEDLHCATFSFIGAVRDVTLGYWDVETRQYQRRTFTGSFEVLSCTGTIARSQLDKPIVHTHMVLGGPDFGTVGGHLFEARVSVTLEGAIHPMPWSVVRVPDPGTGLALMDVKGAKERQ
jgi:uncharacterized protein